MLTREEIKSPKVKELVKVVGSIIRKDIDEVKRYKSIESIIAGTNSFGEYINDEINTINYIKSYCDSHNLDFEDVNDYIYGIGILQIIDDDEYDNDKLYSIMEELNYERR